MTFVWLNKQGVRSSDGFEFQRTGRFTAEYRQGDQIIDLEIESSGMRVAVTNTHALRWRSGLPLSQEGSGKVMKNLAAAFAFMDMRLDQ